MSGPTEGHQNGLMLGQTANSGASQQDLHHLTVLFGPFPEQTRKVNSDLRQVNDVSASFGQRKEWRLVRGAAILL